MPVLVHYSSSFKVCKVATRHLRHPSSARWGRRPVASIESGESPLIVKPESNRHTSGKWLVMHGTGGRKTNPLSVTTATANALLELSRKQESASDRETANAVTLYASRK